MEKFIQILIVIHAILGSIALLSGSLSIATKKGCKLHRKAGSVFFLSMLGSIGISMIVSLLPHHENPFLLSIGVFSVYLILIGKSVLRYKHTKVDTTQDQILILLMISVGILMIFLPPLFTSHINPVTLVFGIVGIFFAIQDWRFVRSKDQWNSTWLLRHISRMTGGYIASVTAFFVVNEILPGLTSWFLPGVIGSFYIVFWIIRIKRKKKKQVFTLAICLFIFGAKTPSSAQVYMEKQTRHRFAQLTLGVDFETTLGGSTTYQNALNGWVTADLPGTVRPRFMIGGTHFWGHADIYIAVPLSFPSTEIENQSVQYLRGVETAFKFYPWRIEAGKIRPFVGTSIAPFYFEQKNGNRLFGNGPERYQTGFPVLGGITLHHKNQLIELIAAWNYDNAQEYFTSRTHISTIKTPPLYLNVSWRWIIDTTLSAEKSWESGKTKKITDQLSQNGGLNDFYLGIGLSSAFWLGESDYNAIERPYVDSYGISIMPDFSLGYYIHEPDLNVGMAYRSYATSTRTYGVGQLARRKSLVLELTKYLGDYHGFAPFLGPAVSLERLYFEESFENQFVLSEKDNRLGYGITFGWDIRPNRIQSWILRTSLRYYPVLDLNVTQDKSINFGNLEFNFIQFVMYPDRFF